MATFRVGVGSFNINDGSVGIGTEGSGHGNLKVEGTLKSTNLDVLGVSTFTRYSGFNADNVSVSNRDLTLSGEYSTTGDIVVEDGASLTVGLGSTACVGSVEYICVKHHFSVPSGDTAQRNEVSGYAEGTIRYNSDLGNMEFFNGDEWKQFRFQIDNGNRGRGIIAGGRAVAGPSNSPTVSVTSSIESIEISTLGNSIDFGQMTATRRNHGNCSSSTRGLMIAGSYNGAPNNNIEYITIASEGNGIDFGDATANDQGESAVASSTRGVHATGNPSNKTMDYVQIATLGNALDFGDRVISLDEHGAIGSSTRGLFCGGGAPSGSAPNAIMQLITIASTGDATTFGDLTETKGQLGGGVSDGVRGAVAGGHGSPKYKKSIDYVTIASEGNAIHFGDLSVARGEQAGAASNQIRGVFAGGTNPNASEGTYLTSIESITIATSGNATFFGDLSVGRERIGGGQISDSHGGLGGY